jgi:hypothetical protein
VSKKKLIKVWNNPIEINNERIQVYGAVRILNEEIDLKNLFYQSKK